MVCRDPLVDALCVSVPHLVMDGIGSFFIGL